jgi:hypothetical protein
MDMCGIVGVLAYNELDKAIEKKRQEVMIYLSSELLQLTQHRGKDATGIATMFSNGDFMGLKMGVPALEFVSRFGGKKDDFQGYVDIWRRRKSKARVAIGHCRKPSIGTAAVTSDNRNNHPIKVNSIIGVHNGTLKNHENIFKYLGCDRDGKVDSEAIFRLLHHLTNKGNDPFSPKVIHETCRRLTGTYAVLAFNKNNPFQAAAFRDGRPLEAMLIKPLKIIIIASEKDILKKVLFRLNNQMALYKGVMPDLILKREDVEIASLPDDSLFLFDLKRDIDKETKLLDLYLEEKVIRTNKIWNGVAGRSASQTKSTIVGAKNPTRPAATATGGQPGTTQMTTCGATTKPKNTGMAWDSGKRKYVTEDKVNRCKQLGNVEVGRTGPPNEICKAKKSRSVDTTLGSSKKITLTESIKPGDDIIGSPASIEIVGIRTPTILKKGTTRSVDMKIDTDVLEKAVKSTQELQSFSDNVELADALEIRGVEAMCNMALYSLANRIKSYFFKKGWYAGYMACKQEQLEQAVLAGSESSMISYRNDMMERARNRIESSQSVIRNMKTVVRILDEICSEAYAEYEAEIIEITERSICNGLEANPEVLKKAFRDGDRRSMPTVDVVLRTLEEEGQEDNSHAQSKEADTGSI